MKPKLSLSSFLSVGALVLATLSPALVSAKGRVAETPRRADAQAKAAPRADAARADAARADGEAPLKKDEVKRRLKGSPYIEVKARDVSLTQASMDRLQRIAKRYFEATHRHLTVTGGTRNPQRQAELMCAKLDHHEDVIALYENKRLAHEIVDAYQKGVAGHLSKARIVRAVRARIEEQVARGEFVSRHLKSGAADVRSRGMSPSQQMAFKKAVSEEPGASILDERDGAAPHFHINL